jgi:hypothetical protein
MDLWSRHYVQTYCHNDESASESASEGEEVYDEYGNTIIPAKKQEKEVSLLPPAPKALPSRATYCGKDNASSRYCSRIKKRNNDITEKDCAEVGRPSQNDFEMEHPDTVDELCIAGMATRRGLEEKKSGLLMGETASYVARQRKATMAHEEKQKKKMEEVEEAWKKFELK